METIGLDLHKRESQLCIGQENGQIVDRRITTSRASFAAVCEGRPRARILLEASTESEWVARHLEALGHEVIVADPNYAPMYAHRTRRNKTDWRDARALQAACATGTFRPVHRTSDARRHVRAEHRVRDALVRTRTRYIALIRTLTRRDGLRLASGEPERIVARMAKLECSATLRAELAPIVAVLTPLNEEIASADRRIAALAKGDVAMERLMTAPAIGAVTASAVVATVDDIHRFRSAHELEAYFGVVPGERSSGEKRKLGSITKLGNAHVRWLLVEAGWRILRSKDADTVALRAWAAPIVARRGKYVAVVALARRLTGILYAMWRDEVPFDARKIRTPEHGVVRARAG